MVPLLRTKRTRIAQDGKCWASGWNSGGQLGIGNEQDELNPVEVLNLKASIAPRL